MPVVHLSPALLGDLADDTLARLDAGSGPARVRLYTGAMPASPASAPGGGNTLLGTLVCSDPCGAYEDGAITFGPVTQDDAADASGEAAWARLTDSDGNGVFDADVSDLAGDGAVKLNTVDIEAGGPIRLSSVVIIFVGG